MAGGIPKYHSYLDYYRPPKKAPAADVWGEINRGVQGMLGGYMKYQQEKDYNNFQDTLAKTYNSVRRDMSQEDFLDKASKIRDSAKLNNDYRSQFDLRISGIVRQLKPQELIDRERVEGEQQFQQKQIAKRGKDIKGIVSELSGKGIANAERFSSQNIGLNRKFNNVKDFVRAMPDVSAEVASNTLSEPSVLKRFEAMKLTPEEHTHIEGLVADKVMTHYGNMYNKIFAEMGKEKRAQEVFVAKKDKEEATYFKRKNAYYNQVGYDSDVLKGLCETYGYKKRQKIPEQLARITRTTFLFLPNAKPEDIKDIYNTHLNSVAPYLSKEIEKDENREIYSKLKSGELKSIVAKLPDYGNNKMNVAAIKKALGKDWNRLSNFLANVVNNNGKVNKLFSDNFKIFVIDRLSGQNEL